MYFLIGIGEMSLTKNGGDKSQRPSISSGGSGNFGKILHFSSFKRSYQGWRKLWKSGLASGNTAHRTRRRCYCRIFQHLGARLQYKPALFVEMGFYADLSWESRCKIEINVRAHIYKILLVLEVPYQVKGMPEKSKPTKIASN